MRRPTFFPQCGAQNAACGIVNSDKFLVPLLPAHRICQFSVKKTYSCIHTKFSEFHKRIPAQHTLIYDSDHMTEWTFRRQTWMHRIGQNKHSKIQNSFRNYHILLMSSRAHTQHRHPRIIKPKTAFYARTPKIDVINIINIRQWIVFRWKNARKHH